MQISNLTSKGSILLAGYGNTFQNFGMTRRAWREVLSDDDADGVVVFEPRGGVPEDSIWTAVDFASGRSSVRSAGDRREPSAVGELRRFEQGAKRALEDARQEAVVVLVFPGKGAWWLLAGDGSSKDDDGKADGRVRLDLASAEPLTLETPASVPNEFGPDDHAILIDPDRMEFILAKLALLSRVTG